MVFANESDPTAQAAHAASLYLAGAYVASLGATAYQTGAYQDQLSRYAGAYAAPTVVTNANLGGLTVPYDGTRIETVATTRATPITDTQATEDLEQEVRVGNAVKAGAYAIYNTGGPIGDYSASNYQSAYVDSLWLAEASKETGRKLF